MPPSPPDTPSVPRIDGDVASGGADTKAAAAKREELARKLRRVASAPNAQGLFANGESTDRPATADVTAPALVPNGNKSEINLPNKPIAKLLPVPIGERGALAFRRTYSSNSIKVRNVEVGPGSFDKIKLIGKGDVGKVYLVREKKSSRLYAMKGEEIYTRREFLGFG